MAQNPSLQVEWVEAFKQYPLEFSPWTTGTILTVPVQRHLLARRIYAHAGKLGTPSCPSLKWSLTFHDSADAVCGTIARNNYSNNGILVPPYYRSDLAMSGASFTSGYTIAGGLALQVTDTSSTEFDGNIKSFIPPLDLTADCCAVKLNVISPTDSGEPFVYFYLGVLSSVKVKG